MASEYSWILGFFLKGQSVQMDLKAYFRSSARTQSMFVILENFLIACAGKLTFVFFNVFIFKVIIKRYQLWTPCYKNHRRSVLTTV